MPDSPVSGLPASGALSGVELFYADSGVADVRVTANQIKAFAAAGGGGGTPGGSSGQIQFNNAGAFGGMTGVQVSAFISSSGLYNAQTGTAYTLQASDNGKIVTLTNGAAVTLTCPAGLGAGFSCMIVQGGAGQVGLVASGGATLNAFGGFTHLASQYAMGTLICPTASNFILGGQLA